MVALPKNVKFKKKCAPFNLSTNTFDFKGAILRWNYYDMKNLFKNKKKAFYLVGFLRKDEISFISLLEAVTVYQNKHISEFSIKFPKN